MRSAEIREVLLGAVAYRGLYKKRQWSLCRSTLAFHNHRTPFSYQISETNALIAAGSTEFVFTCAFFFSPQVRRVAQRESAASAKDASACETGKRPAVLAVLLALPRTLRHSTDPPPKLTSKIIVYFISDVSLIVVSLR